MINGQSYFHFSFRALVGGSDCQGEEMVLDYEDLVKLEMMKIFLRFSTTET